jgi:hypothetical protein
MKLVFRILVVTNAAEVPQDVAHSYGPLFFRKVWNVGLNLGIEIDLALIDQLQNSHSGHGL